MHAHLRVLSDTILAIHRAARAGAACQRDLLSHLRPLLPFDAAWWGLNSGLHLHTTHADGLPATYAAEWERLKDIDVVARAVLPAPERAHLFGPRDLAAEPAFDAFLARHSVRHVACVFTRQERMGLGAFLSLYRSDRPFDTGEATMLDAVFPHMMDALRHGWRAERDGPRSGTDGLRALAQTDGLILSASAGFEMLLRTRWPDWRGPWLPGEVARSLVRSGSITLGRRRLEWTPQGPYVILRAGDAGVAVCLTCREAEVAERYSRGEGHKAIATALDIAPTTVRHYIRNIYAKLHVSDKATLVRVLLREGP